MTGRRLAALILPLIGASGLSFAAEPPPVFTVCEIMSDLPRCDGKSVVVVGRYSHTGEGGWLDAECGVKISNGGRELQTSISITYAASEFSPPPTMPPGFRWDDRLLQQKLEPLKRTTALRVLEKFHYTDEWMAVFGRLETHIPREIPVTYGRHVEIFGFGHQASSPAQLVWPKDAFRTLK